MVVTLPPGDIQGLMAAPDTEFAAAMESRFQRRLGNMSLASTRHAYPLVGVYPRRFVAERFALIGDAAVGMHPVTAHGFNFGLLGQDLLGRAIRHAQAGHTDIGDPRHLARYAGDLRRATRPLYLATSAITRLYTDDSRPGTPAAPRRPVSRCRAPAPAASPGSQPDPGRGQPCSDLPAAWPAPRPAALIPGLYRCR